MRAPDPGIGYGIQVKLNSVAGIVRNNVSVANREAGVVIEDCGRRPRRRDRAHQASAVAFRWSHRRRLLWVRCRASMSGGIRSQ